MRETWVCTLGWEDPLEKEMAIHSSTLAWKIPWTEEPGRLQSMGSQRVGHEWAAEHTQLRINMGSSEFCFCKFAWNLRIVFLFSPFPHYQHLSVTDSNNAFKITSLLEVNFNIPFLMEKEMATHSSTLAWKIRWMEKPGRLQSMESQSQTPLSNFTSSSWYSGKF